MGELSKDNLLRSWKEIAAYLGCDIRTCHRWEHDRGMPVHRAEGGETKSPVFAHKDELDAWFRETFKSSNGPREGLGNGRTWLKWAAGGMIVLALAGAFLLFRGARVRRQPADFAIDGSTFYRPGQGQTRALAQGHGIGGPQSDGILPGQLPGHAHKRVEHPPARSS